MSSILSYLPQHEGLLPKWLLFVSLISVGNSIQAYLTTTFTAGVYEGTPPSTAASRKPATPSNPYPNSTVNPLTARIFGTWTLLACMIRFYAAYYVSNPQIYQMAFLTYFVAWAHFHSEWLVFGSARWGKGIAGPAFISTGTLVWMWMQWGYYVQ